MKGPWEVLGLKPREGKVENSQGEVNGIKEISVDVGDTGEKWDRIWYLD